MSVKLIRESRPLARFPHSCSICSLPIAIGTEYSCVVIRDSSRSDRNKNLVQLRWHLPLCPREVRND